LASWVDLSERSAIWRHAAQGAAAFAEALAFALPNNVVDMRIGRELFAGLIDDMQAGTDDHDNGL
jgi:hypothetical protein